jgi:nicotinate dehydrogenase subunit A
MRKAIHFGLNGRPVSIDTDDERTLLWVLRTDFGLTGPKYGCGAGLCGACTVTVGGEAVRSCQTLLKEASEKEVVTIEGLSAGGELHPLQRAFMAHGGFQCGYCTSGMIMQASALLARNPSPSREEIVQGLDSNLCRCGAHHRILAAVQAAAKGGGAP